ncbi:glycosyltransferase [Paenibacillus antri]|uniref:Glycosyltransferase n=1 Tax=Paenibacillus antri TaxID=2582848 RepID=A0A5R9G9E8_9BACL|nr:glycosyltransferase [Paenibacillus antri]TLS50986.1 glycosyltransferase [Paenibacillus antri]
MNTRFIRFAVIGLSLLALAMPAAAQAAGNERIHADSRTVQLKFGLRKLWVDHAVWTRSYMVSAVAGLDDQEEVLERLSQHQQHLGNAMIPYYGEEAGQRLAELLTEHIRIAGNVVAAAKHGNKPEMEKCNQAWVRNADDIASFLSGANPHWSKKELQQLLYRHLNLLTDALQARLSRNWRADIAAFDLGEANIIVWADVLADGIVKQFPQKF